MRLGVRLNKLFEGERNPLNLGGAKVLYMMNAVNNEFRKSMESLSLLKLENAAHFFDENVFRYFHAVSLGEGQVFGDLGILTKKPRAATIVCTEDCYFGVLGLEDY